MRKQLAFLTAVCLLAAVPAAHSQNTADPYSTGSSSQVDCSDPMNSLSEGCAQPGQTSTMQGGQQQGYGSQATGAQSYGQTSQTGLAQPTASSINNRTYIDNGGLLNQGQMSRYQRGFFAGPPEPLTEFQRFVAGSTGEVLPIYGASLFQNTPSTFSPVEQVPVTANYVIGPGDELRVRVWGQVNFNADVRVDRSGEIYLPQVGAVHVAGLQFSEVAPHLRADISRIFRNFNLTVNVGQLRSIQIFMVGQARRPGSYTVSSLSTLVNALFATGGPSVSGSLRHILLKRNGQTVTDFDFYDFLVNGDKSKDVSLLSGDVIYIQPVGPQVALAGSVRHPAIFELREDTTVAQLLSYAGGASNVAASSRISIERLQGNSGRQAMEVGFDSTGLATTLKDGDILRVLSVVPAFQKTVTLRGNTANPGNFAWHKGMRLSELIPDRESLLTRNYWWRRSRLGLPTPEFEPFVTGPLEYQPSHPVNMDTLHRQQEWRNETQMSYANRYSAGAESGGSSQPNASGQQQQQQQRPMAPVPAPYDAYSYQQQPLQGAQMPQDQSYPQGVYYGVQQQQDGKAPIQPSVQTNSPYGSSGQQAQQNSAASSALGASQSEVITQNTAGASTRTDVRIPAPEIDWDYAVIERLDPQTLKTSLIPFNLGKLVMAHDQSQNLELEPGDVVSILSQADIRVPTAEQTKFVRLEGEFKAAGIYSVKPGETLRELVARAGGLTPNAYLFGSEFTRQSTRVLQQARIDEYVQGLELQIERGGIATAAAATGSSQDLTGVNAAAMANERELISRLQQIRATGRVVLQIDPNAKGIAALPNLPLEDGDKFVVPSTPATVNVVGAVYDQNSFFFGKGGRIGDFLHQAGGPNRDADRKHTFIIRADGSVISREATSGVWGNTFEATRMHPGDTIVVPEKTFKPTALRTFIDYSQIFSQLATGVAFSTFLIP
ncbi:SLBB domain-containing protein [Acidipila rosea]|uniref:Protein involved in polysaccharide export with SLBB domain n=1 Tax=Acidipila rosea TaxID=768535 RepID=A0A4R1L9L2_9BACT|nr:SLBB domain-containing protein [Acidipila rosea]TCK75038.1 protein involved in polysaccharide export with SLBB domain [Acidipila rosea]